MKRALIVAGGRIETAFCLQYMDSLDFDYTIAVDYGLQFFYDTKRTPNLIVGDFDSADQAALRFFEAQEGIAWIRLAPEKDDTDTECAVRAAAAKGFDQIHILGGTGSRMDHVLCNVWLLEIGFQENTELLLVDSHNRIRMIKDRFVLEKEEQYGKYISLLPFTPEASGVTLKGMKYPLAEYTLKRRMSLGISNEIDGERMELTLRDGILLVFESKD